MKDRALIGHYAGHGRAYVAGLFLVSMHYASRAKMANDFTESCRGKRDSHTDFLHNLFDINLRDNS